jgi:hypothetical protein
MAVGSWIASGWGLVARGTNYVSIGLELLASVEGKRIKVKLISSS